MSTFELTRLYGGRDKLDFGSADDGVAISVWFHHAQPEEIAIALDKAGLEQDGEEIQAKGDGGHYQLAARLVQASVELACLCIEDIENWDHWPACGKAKSKGSHGLMTLDDDIKDRLPRIVLRDVGEAIFKKSSLGSEEKKDSGVSPTLDS